MMSRPLLMGMTDGKASEQLTETPKRPHKVPEQTPVHTISGMATTAKYEQDRSRGAIS